MSSHHKHSRHYSRSRVSHHPFYHRPIHQRNSRAPSNYSSHPIGSSNIPPSSRGSQQSSSGYISNNIRNPEAHTSDWSEHHSSSGKVYYYNTRTGVSQWEIPNELKQLQQQQHQPHHQHHQHQHHQPHHQHHQHSQQQNREPSPESELSESSSIRQHDKSPSSSASSHRSSHPGSVLPEDKPLLTPSLAQYYRSELIESSEPSHIEELERQANQCSQESLLLNEKILKESVEIKMAKALFNAIDITLDAQEKKIAVLKSVSRKFGFA